MHDLFISYKNDQREKSQTACWFYTHVPSPVAFLSRQAEASPSRRERQPSISAVHWHEWDVYGGESANIPLLSLGSEGTQPRVAPAQQPGGVAGTLLCRQWAPCPGSRRSSLGLPIQGAVDQAEQLFKAFQSGFFISSRYPQEKATSVHCAIVGFVELVEGEIHSVRGDGFSVQRV